MVSTLEKTLVYLDILIEELKKNNNFYETRIDAGEPVSNYQHVIHSNIDLIDEIKDHQEFLKYHVNGAR